MIDAAGLVDSEGERGLSMLSITGQAAGTGPLVPGQRWSLARKHEVVLRLLRGEPVEAVSRQLGVPVWQLERWRARAQMRRWIISRGSVRASSSWASVRSHGV